MKRVAVESYELDLKMKSEIGRFRDDQLMPSITSLISAIGRKRYSIGHILDTLNLSLRDLSLFFSNQEISSPARRVVDLDKEDVQKLADFFVKEVKRACRKGKYSSQFVTTKVSPGKDVFAIIQSGASIEDFQELFLDEEAIYAWFWSILDGDSPAKVLGIEPSKAYGLLLEVSKQIKSKLTKRGRLIDARWEFFRVATLHQFYIFPEEDNSSNTTFCFAS